MGGKNDSKDQAQSEKPAVAGLNSEDSLIVQDATTSEETVRVELVCSVNRNQISKGIMRACMVEISINQSEKETEKRNIETLKE